MPTREQDFNVSLRGQGLKLLRGTYCIKWQLNERQAVSELVNRILDERTASGVHAFAACTPDNCHSHANAFVMCLGDRLYAFTTSELMLREAAAVSASTGSQATTIASLRALSAQHEQDKNALLLHAATLGQANAELAQKLTALGQNCDAYRMGWELWSAWASSNLGTPHGDLEKAKKAVAALLSLKKDTTRQKETIAKHLKSIETWKAKALRFKKRTQLRLPKIEEPAE